MSVALVLVALLAWAYTMGGIGMGMNAFEMTSMPSTAGNMNSMPMPEKVGTGYFFVVLAMWWVWRTPTFLVAARCVM